MSIRQMERCGCIESKRTVRAISTSTVIIDGYSMCDGGTIAGTGDALIGRQDVLAPVHDRQRAHFACNIIQSPGKPGFGQRV